MRQWKANSKIKQTTDNIPKEKEKKRHTLLWWCIESVLHLPLNGNEFNDLVVLPVPNILQELHILFGVVQFNNFRFFLRTSRFLLDLDRSVTHSWEPRFWDPSVRSMVALGMPWAGAVNPTIGIGGMKEWGNRNGI